jgi:hypothetical protein
MLRTSALILVTLIAGAATANPERVTMDTAQKRSLTSAVIVKPADPRLYRVLPDLAQGSAEIKGAETQAMNLTASLRPNPRLSSALARGLQDELERRGVRTRMIDVPPAAAGKALDYAELKFKEQMIVEPTLAEAGYRWTNGVLRPVVTVQLRVLDATTRQVKMAERFAFADKTDGSFVLLPPAQEFTFANTETLFAEGERAAYGLRTAVAAITDAAVPLMREWDVQIKPRGKVIEVPLQ